MLMIGCFQNDNNPNKWEMSVSQTVCGEGPALSFSEDITGWDGVLCAWCLLPPQDTQHWVSTTPICHFCVCSILSWIDNKQLTDTQLRDHTLNSTWSQAEPSPVKAIVLGRVPRWHWDTSLSIGHIVLLSRPRFTKDYLRQAQASHGGTFCIQDEIPGESGNHSDWTKELVRCDFQYPSSECTWWINMYFYT